MSGLISITIHFHFSRLLISYKYPDADFGATSQLAVEACLHSRTVASCSQWRKPGQWLRPPKSRTLQSLLTRCLAASAGPQFRTLTATLGNVGSAGTCIRSCIVILEEHHLVCNRCSLMNRSRSSRTLAPRSRWPRRMQGGHLFELPCSKASRTTRRNSSLTGFSASTCHWEFLKKKVMMWTPSCDMETSASMKSLSWVMPVTWGIDFKCRIMAVASHPSASFM